MNFTFTPHAIKQIQRRGIPINVILIVLQEPDEIIPADNDRKVYQGIVEINGKTYILRAVIENESIVVTVYLTSKVNKYGSNL